MNWNDLFLSTIQVKSLLLQMYREKKKLMILLITQTLGAI